MSESLVQRWLRGFDKQTERLAVEYPLPSQWTVERLRALFAVRDDDPMFGCFPINEAIARILEPSFGFEIPTERYDFFLEADAL
jgi:hypothetical protein